jgi:hypothetical protein
LQRSREARDAQLKKKRRRIAFVPVTISGGEGVKETKRHHSKPWWIKSSSNDVVTAQSEIFDSFKKSF